MRMSGKPEKIVSRIISWLSFIYETVTGIGMQILQIVCKRLPETLKHSTDSDIITHAG